MVSSERRKFLTQLPGQVMKTLCDIGRNGGILGSHPSQGIPADMTTAKIEITLCHAWTGLSCQQCYLACPKRDTAIEIRDQKPVITAALCDGCGECLEACKTVNDTPAVRMMPRDFQKQSSVDEKIAS